MRNRLLPFSFLLLATLGVPLYALTACTRPSPAPLVAPDSPSPGSFADAAVADARATVEQCRALYDRAQVESLAAWNRASKACKTDGDCVLASKRACLNDCGGFPIATTSFDEWKKAYGAIEASTCKAYLDGQCATTLPMASPTCPAYHASCRRGECFAK